MYRNIILFTMALSAFLPGQSHAATSAEASRYISFIMDPIMKAGKTYTPIQLEGIAEAIADYIKGKSQKTPDIPAHMVLGLGPQYRIKNIEYGNIKPTDAQQKANASHYARVQRLRMIAPLNEIDKKYRDNTILLLNAYLEKYTSHMKKLSDRILDRYQKEVEKRISEMERISEMAGEA